MQATENHVSLREALDRTLLLMRDDVTAAATDSLLLDALTRTTVCIATDERNIRSHSAQSAFVTTALLLARSGHRVYLNAPNVQLVGPQPPLKNGEMIEQLWTVGQNLLPGRGFRLGMPKQPDLVVLLGNTPWHGRSKIVLRIQASAWGGRVTEFEPRAWPDEDWPIGGMVAAGLVVPEAFKISMRRLRAFAKHTPIFDELHAPVGAVTLNIAPSQPEKISNLQSIDFVSGGAITNAALYALLRLPNLYGTARVIEDDVSALSNLNRCMLFLRPHLGDAKAAQLATYATPNFAITPCLERFNPRTAAKIGQLADAVMVGVDHIPSRWDVQKTWPNWLGIGATSHQSAMASFHIPEVGCAGCAHPADAPDDGRVQTVSFVSFWAGLWTATLYLRFLANDHGLRVDQQYYFTPLRPETLFHTPVPRRNDCPIQCTHLLRQAG